MEEETCHGKITASWCHQCVPYLDATVLSTKNLGLLLEEDKPVGQCEKGSTSLKTGKRLSECDSAVSFRWVS